MPHESHNPKSDKWRDRLVDRALEEALAGDAPPDLSDKILAAAAETDASPSVHSSRPGDLTMATAPATQKFGLRGWVLAASLLINCGLLTALAIPSLNTFFVVAAQDPARIVESGGLPTQEGKQSEQTDFDELIEMVEETASSDAWKSEAGEQEPFPSNLSLKGTQSQQVHEMAEEGKVFPVADKVLPFRDEFERSSEGGQTTNGKVNLNAHGSKDHTLPSPRYLQDDVQYHPPSPEFGLSREATQLGSQGEGQDVIARGVYGYDRGAAVEAPVVGDRLKETGQRSQKQEAVFAFVDPARVRAGDQWGFRGAKWRSNQGDGRGEWPNQDDFSTMRGFDWQGSPDGEGIGPGASGDKYERIHENPFVPAIGEEAISTFSIDVDTASYANIRQMLMNGQVPPPDAVRIEELVNYFEYGYDGPESTAPGPSPEGRGEEDAPFAAHVETAGCPWRPAHRLVRIGIKGREVEAEKRPLSNLVFLVDVSGSMSNPEKLPLVKHGLKKLAANLGENDRVAIVVYASQEGLVLPSTPCTEQETILAALDQLQSGGSTAGGAGIRLAYQIAEDNFIEGGTNRVILCTDGDFNVGTTSAGELERLVEKKAKDTKVFLSCIGFGRGNLNDAMMEKITGIGNGNYFYADGEREAERIFVKGMTGMLVTIAKDVKIQVEFNPVKVAGYRLLGYENRMLKTQDFNDDKKDAGEIGAGHTVTCLYEIVPAGEPVDVPEADPLKYQRPAGLTDAADTGELLTLKMRYKQPDEDTSTKLEWPVNDDGRAFASASQDFQFAASVAGLGMLLRDSIYKGDSNYDAVLEIAQSAKGPDSEGERAEFLELVAAAKRLKPVATEETEEPASEE